MAGGGGCQPPAAANCCCRTATDLGCGHGTDMFRPIAARCCNSVMVAGAASSAARPRGNQPWRNSTLDPVAGGTQHARARASRHSPRRISRRSSTRRPQAAAARRRRPETRSRSSSPAPAAPTAPSPTARCRSTSSAPRRSANTGQTETNQILNQLVPVVQLPAAVDRRRHRRAAPGDAARPRPRPDAGAGQRQAPPRLGAAQHQRHGRPRQRGGRPQPDPGTRDRAGSRCCATAPSSQYGSDAIAGVINIQLKNANHGGRASATYGKYDTTLDDVAERHRPADQRRRPADPRSRPTNRYLPRQHRRRAQGARRRAADRSAPISACRSAAAASSTSPPNIATATDQPRRLRPRGPITSAGARPRSTRAS